MRKGTRNESIFTGFVRFVKGRMRGGMLQNAKNDQKTRAGLVGFGSCQIVAGGNFCRFLSIKFHFYKRLWEFGQILPKKTG
jgi:hypothetical protein